jgi:predicted amidohydrolase
MVVEHEHASYCALALQTRCEAVNGLGVDAARARIMQSIDRIGEQIGAAKALLGEELRLVVLPEYILTGFPMGEPINQWAAMAAIAPDGPEAAALAAIAVQHGLYLAVNAYEQDRWFAPLYFQAALVFGPDGGLALRSHRLISLYAPTPVHVWDAYCDRYGLDHIIPVAATAIGTLGAIASEEILYPEIARIAALRGAEVLLHSTGEMGSPLATAKELCRLARAAENSAYVVSANAAALLSGAVPAQTTDGMSKIVDHRGLVLAAALPGETIAAHAEIDLCALRRHRTRVGMGTVLARVPTTAIAEVLTTLPTFPSGGLQAAASSGKAPGREFFKASLGDVVERLVAERRLRLPPSFGDTL